MSRFLVLMLVVCGLAATGAQARPRTAADRVSAIGDDGTVALATLGPAQLAGIALLQPELLPRQLKAGQVVQVKSLGRDRYNRAQIILFLSDAETSLQEKLLADGAAVVFGAFATPRAWPRAEAQAQEAKRGIWADAAWHATPDTAKQRLGKFALVTGRVHAVAERKDATYLNFGEDWRSDFTATVAARHRRAFRDRLAGLQGKRVRVRGVVHRANGAMVTLTRPEQLELLDDSARKP